MEKNTRQVTIIDELWDNEESKTNRRLYDEQDRGLQRQNIELNDRIKKFEKQLEVLKNNQLKDHDKELIKRILSKQANEYNKLVTKKDQEIEQLNEQVRQLSKSNLLESALRQSNIERLHLEKRFLSSTSSLNSTTTTNAGIEKKTGHFHVCNILRKESDSLLFFSTFPSLNLERDTKRKARLGGIARKPRPVTAKGCSIDLTDLTHLFTVGSSNKVRNKLKISSRTDDPFWRYMHSK
ncbi:unnamed protein product [Rotaria magnacalcarata]|uniref:Uncharacterized protein n=1 Tax=Rotaria magnacalcarata TaxID=392030 RepID=A0A8S2SS36_9BILA|nr:unnamed protein product [Rotaria magnacalcarata]